ncbi:MAG: ATP-binding protein [Eubacteriaceae bacterium]|nr:ATP-binding protein [Eubacteriaceae bacterium]
MKKLPLGIQNFREIIHGGYVYVDKTSYIYSLFNDAKYYFVSRPRRFGKSLLLDTISEVFSGDKELFKGLWIYNSDYEFKKYPVVRFDMSNIANETPELLKESLAAELKMLAGEEGLESEHRIPSDLFKHLIRYLYKKYNQQVVVLIDEYDKPIIDHILDAKTAEENRNVLRGFFGILKSMDQYLRFTMFTGVSKFAKTSIFSELNNLLDITMTKKYANICGIGLGDLDDYFGDHIEILSTLDDLQVDGGLRNKIMDWYDGYSWDGENRLINPFSLLSFLQQKRFSSYWYASGTPKFLIDIIKDKPYSYLGLKNLEVSEKAMDIFDINKMDLALLLFQTGYLTVAKTIYREGEPYYQLEIPNKEVNEAFTLQLVCELTDNSSHFVDTTKIRIMESLATGDLHGMLEILRSLFASIPYQLHVDREAYYHSIFYAVLVVLGFEMDVEVSTSRGCVDAVLELCDKVYVMEFKYSECPPDADHDVKSKKFDSLLQEAMSQILERGYHAKYIGGKKSIYLVAFAFFGRDNIEMRIETY